MTLLRSAVAAVLAFVVLGTFVASGAHLTVSGPILQSFAFEVDHSPPPAAETAMYIEVHMYAGAGNGPLKATARLGPFTVPAGGQYVLEYDGTVRACPGEEIATRVGGPFAVTGEDHPICVQHGGADGRTVTIRVGDDEQRRTVVLDAEPSPDLVDDQGES